jgi:HEAT repeat protein
VSWLLPPLPPTFDAAVRDVEARDPHARVAAARRLARADAGQEARARRALEQLTADPIAAVRAAALESLAEGDASECRALLTERLSDPDATVRELALIALLGLESEAATEQIRRALRSPHPELRFQAVLGYAERAGDAAEREVRAALRDEDAKVRAHAARAVAIAGLAGLAPALAELLDDGSDEPRYEAALALAALGDARGAPALCDALGDPDRAIEALEALGGLGAGPHVESVAVLAASLLKPPWVKVAAARCLLRLGDRRGTAALRECLRGFRRGARGYAVEVVGELAVTELAGELARLAKRPRGAQRAQVAEALARLAASIDADSADESPAIPRG